MIIYHNFIPIITRRPVEKTQISGANILRLATNRSHVAGKFQQSSIGKIFALMQAVPSLGAKTIPMHSTPGFERDTVPPLILMSMTPRWSKKYDKKYQILFRRVRYSNASVNCRRF